MSENEESILYTTGSVFDVTKHPNAEEMKIKARLMSAAMDSLARKRWKQAQAAQKLGITQPRVSDLKRGRISQFSIEMLIKILANLEDKVTLVLEHDDQTREEIMLGAFKPTLKKRAKGKAVAPELVAQP